MIIFEIENEKIKINENCHLIPELKALIDKYEEPVAALAYVHYMTHPESPYHNLSQSEKSEIISDDVGGDFGLDDEEIDNALIKLRKLYETPVQEYYEGQKNSMHMVGKYLKTLSETSLTTGRDGNLSEIVRMQKEAGRTMESFLKLEKLWKEQAKQQMRGGAEMGEY